MLNLKKGLALVLAAATAFTFAPVANLGAPVQAEAASVLANVNLKPGKSLNETFGTYNEDNISVTVDDTTVATATEQDGAASYVSGKRTYKFAGLKGGSTVAHVYNGSTEIGVVNIHVDKLSTTPNITLTGTRNGNTVTYSGTNGGYVTIPNDVTNLTVSVASEQSAYDAANGGSSYSGITVDSLTSEYVTVASNKVSAVANKTGGPVTITVKGTAPDGNAFTYTLNITTVTHASTVKVLGKEVKDDAKNAGTQPGTVGVVELTPSASTKKIDTSIVNAQDTKEKLYFTAWQNNVQQDGTINKNGITVDKDGNVSATAEGFEHTGYKVLVSNYDPADPSVSYVKKSVWVTVITRGNARTFTSVSVAVDGQTYGSVAAYQANGSIKDGEKTASLTLSTKDKTSVPVTLTPSDAEVSSDDTSVVAYENGSLVAKKAGIATVTITKKASATTWGIAKVILTVNVTNKNALNTITASDVTLTSDAPKATIKAESTYKNTLHYNIVKQDAAGNWVVANDDKNITLDPNTGVATYVNNGTKGSVTVQITGDANDTAEAPTPARITVKYQAEKDDSNLVVNNKAISLKSGDTAKIDAVATGTSISYTSYAPEIATVDANGVVTAVSKGTAVVAVNAAKTDTMKAGQELVFVTVDNGKIAAPDKVAGLKVTNAKGAKVNVSWTSQGKNIQYRVYKKVGNGKWVAKNVTKGKATLSVKKGAKVQVKVKAFVKDQDGKTVWGPKATKKTFKTDNK